MTSFETSVIATVMERTHTRSAAAQKLSIRIELEAIETKLHELLLKTIFEDENASVILYGYPGQGKSLVVDRVMGRLEADLHSKGEKVVCRVDVNGLMDGDKREGLKSIARQLCAFLDVGFLSHASAEQNIQFLKHALEKLHGAEMSCVFVLDAFERFVKDSEKQEIVYTLLDLLQSGNVRSCVIGMTTDFRIKSDFDKRVHSRFSHKSWIIPKCDDIFSVIRSTMEMPKTKKNKKIDTYNHSIATALNDPMIQAYSNVCQGCFSPRDAGHIAILAVTNAMSRSPKPFVVSAEDVQYAFEQCIKQHDPLPLKIAELPAPQLYMLVACAQLESKFTAKTAFAKYEGFIRKQSTSDIFEEPLMTHAFHDCIHANLIIRSKDTKSISLITPHTIITLFRRGWSTASSLEVYSLNVTKTEIHRGICVNPFASTVLHAFFKSE